MAKHNYLFAQKILNPNLSETAQKQSPKKGEKVNNFLDVPLSKDNVHSFKFWKFYSTTRTTTMTKKTT